MAEPSGHRARKRFGQNFLQDEHIIQSIIDCVAPRSHQHFFEIGPGLGALTRPLLQHLDRLDVIELDRDVIPLLKRNCGEDDKLTVHESDVLKFDFGSHRYADGLRIVGNLPYNISTAVLFHLLSYRADIKDMHFMLQKEVVDRICAVPGNKDYGRLSIMLQTWFDTDWLFDVPPESFSPAPKVMSAIVRLVPHDRFEERIRDPQQYAEMVRLAFSQRRKTLRNTLRSVCSSVQMEAAGIDPGARAEQLEVADFITLHQSLT